MDVMLSRSYEYDARRSGSQSNNALLFSAFRNFEPLIKSRLGVSQRILVQMNNHPIFILFGAALLAAIGAVATALALGAQRPCCPSCQSPEVDEYPAHGICRECGKRFEWVKRFGSCGGSDL
jgi:hypothetical protein